MYFEFYSSKSLCIFTGLVTFASLAVGSLGLFPLEQLLEPPVWMFVKQHETLSLHPLSPLQLCCSRQTGCSPVFALHSSVCFMPAVPGLVWTDRTCQGISIFLDTVSASVLLLDKNTASRWLEAS